jgi:hypothetical protein
MLMMIRVEQDGKGELVKHSSGAKALNTTEKIAM